MNPPIDLLLRNVRIVTCTDDGCAIRSDGTASRVCRTVDTMPPPARAISS